MAHTRETRLEELIFGTAGQERFTFEQMKRELG